jgi:hypothetical protein
MATGRSRWSTTTKANHSETGIDIFKKTHN